MTDLDEYVRDMSKASLLMRFRQAIQDRLDAATLNVSDRRVALAQLVIQKTELEKEQTAFTKSLS